MVNGIQRLGGVRSGHELPLRPEAPSGETTGERHDAGEKPLVVTSARLARDGMRMTESGLKMAEQHPVILGLPGLAIAAAGLTIGILGIVGTVFGVLTLPFEAVGRSADGNRRSSQAG